MDFSELLSIIKRVLMGFAIALILMLSLHSLGLGWKSSFALALLPAVLGSLNIFAGRIFTISGLVMIVACASVVLVDGDEPQPSPRADASALGKAKAALVGAAPTVDAVVAQVGPQVGALATAAAGALDRVAAHAPAAGASAAAIVRRAVGSVVPERPAAAAPSAVPARATGNLPSGG